MTLARLLRSSRPCQKREPTRVRCPKLRALGKLMGCTSVEDAFEQTIAFLVHEACRNVFDERITGHGTLQYTVPR